MTTSNVEELKELKEYLEDELSRLAKSCEKWEIIGTQESLSRACVLDTIEEDRLGQNCEVYSIAAANDISKNSTSKLKSQWRLSAPSLESLSEISETCGWKIDSTGGSHPTNSETIAISDETGEKTQLHKVRWLYSGSNDDVIPMCVTTEYQTKETNGTLFVSNVNISLDMSEEAEDYFMQSEISPLIQFCNTTANLPAFFSNASKLLKAWQKRRMIMKRFKLQREFRRRSPRKTAEIFTLMFANERGHALARLNWTIRIYVPELHLKENINVKFSSQGGKLARECNLPDELVSKGNCTYWSVEEYITNIQRLASFDFESSDI